jgi:hypothetical protein
MMQPMPMWQSNTGHLARAAMAGVDYSNEQKKAEQAARLGEAQIQQTGAQVKQTDAQTGKLKADTEVSLATKDKLVQDLEDTRSMHDLKIDELKGKIELARKQGLLDDAQAKALGQKLEADPKYRGAVIDELQAKAFYYRNPQLRGGSNSTSDPAVLKLVRARTDALQASGMSEEAAAAQAWSEVGTGAAGAKNNAEDQAATRRLRILKRDYMSDKAKDKSLPEFSEWLRLWHKDAGIGSEDEKLAMRVRELALGEETQAAPTPAPAPGKTNFPPIPTKMGPKGFPVIDETKLVPGVTYMDPTNKPYTHRVAAK